MRIFTNLTLVRSVLIVCFLALCLTACGGKLPSVEERIEAIKNGEISSREANDKGWFDEEFYNYMSAQSEQYQAEHAGELLKIYAFSTVDLDGNTITQDIFANQVLVAFFNPSNSEDMEQMQIIADTCEQLKAGKIEILGVLLGSNSDETIITADTFSFPVIVYNDTLQKAFQDYSDVITDRFAYTYAIDGNFKGAWSGIVTEEDLLKLISHE